MNRSLSAPAAIPVPAAVPWIDWTARRISDPVVRLRFLRAAAPAWQAKPARKFSVALSACLALVALLAAGRYAVARREATALSHAQAAVEVAANPVHAPALVVPAGMALPKAEPAPEIWQV